MINKISSIGFSNISKFNKINTTNPFFRGGETLKTDTFEKTSIEAKEIAPREFEEIPWNDVRQYTNAIIKKPENSKAEIEKIDENGKIAQKNAKKMIDGFKKELQKEAKQGTENAETTAIDDDFQIIIKNDGEFGIDKISLYVPEENSYLVVDYKNQIKAKEKNGEITQYLEGYANSNNGREVWENGFLFKNGFVSGIVQEGEFDIFEDNYFQAKKELILTNNKNGERVVQEYLTRDYRGILSRIKVYHNN